ncbi:Polar amino acid transport system substrate-binding protein OS=Castellaniella defragrans OX=75697 GN=HNR28_000821 PE=4 SV=1 [Castellaniella defragrans]
MKPSIVRIMAKAMAACALLCAPLLSSAAEHFNDTITLGVANEPPYTIYQVGKPVTGAEPDIVRAIVTKMGVKNINAEVLEFSAMIPSLLSGRIDVIAAGLYITPSRCKAVAFSEPTLCSGQVLAVLKNNPSHLHSLGDVAADKAIKIGVCSGCEVQKLALTAGVSSTNMLVAPDHQSGVQMLLDGRVQAYAGPDISIREAIEKLGVGAKVDVVEAQGIPAQCAAVAFRPDQAGLRDTFDKGLKELKASGEYTKIVSKYGFSPDLVQKATRASYCQGGK